MRLQMVVEISDKWTFEILKREWQKVWFRNEYSPSLKNIPVQKALMHVIMLFEDHAIQFVSYAYGHIYCHSQFQETRLGDQ